MKEVILWLLFVPIPAFCQIAENFETGNLNRWVQSINGHWNADSSASVSGKWSLHHSYDNPDAGNDQIGIPLDNLKPSMGTTKWSFKVRYGYDPSSTNNWSVFLMADNGPVAMVPGANNNGFAIGVNQSGNDDTLRLWKMKEGAVSSVLNTGINWQIDIGINRVAEINVERSQAGEWKVVVISEGKPTVSATTGIITDVFSANWFGIYYRYTSTRDRLLWLDDINIEGVFFKDIEPPKVESCTVTGRNSVDLTLNEEVATEFMSVSNFSLNEENKPSSRVVKLNSVSYRIEFDNRFINKSINNIKINLLCDKFSNCSNNIFIPFMPVWAETGDILISEIMADPVPSVTLPEREYIELANRTEYLFTLKNWQLSTKEQNAVLPEILMRPGEHIILCAIQDTSLFSRYGKTIGIKSFPSLYDSGRLIFLSDSSENLIHGVEYSQKWYRDILKTEGGWSLEIIDPEFPFFQEGNWAASVSRTGGTPGRQNSVSRTNPDNSFTGLINVFPEDSVTIDITFSETVKNIERHTNESLLNGLGVQSIFSEEPLQREFVIKPLSYLITSQLYTITFPEAITDFAGNKMHTNSFIFGLPEPVVKEDVVFNELMFNPFPGDADYLEFYNSSGKIIDASTLYLVSVNDDTGDTSELTGVSNDNRCILPGSYYTITTNREAVINRYFSSDPDRIFQTDMMPPMSDDKGHLILFNRQLDLIDEIYYNEKMHYSLLSGYEGIALEKIRPDNSSTVDHNWHSASEASGWGTPGAPNSISSDRPVSDENVVLSSALITPDNNGFQDVLVIDLNLKSIGNVVTAEVFDETGSYIRKIADNLLAGSHSSVFWDGTADDGSLVRTGIYIILISVFDETGKTVRWKKVCTVIR